MSVPARSRIAMLFEIRLHPHEIQLEVVDEELKKGAYLGLIWLFKTFNPRNTPPCAKLTV
jgi:hypothetical protein